MVESSATVTTVKLPLGPLVVDIDGESLTAPEADFLRHPAVGAVILFARNYRDKAQLGELTRAIKALRAPELLVAVDQEGGSVQRLDSGFCPLPGAADLGARYDRDRDRARKAAAVAGQLMAAEVAGVGVDFSFAPVVDCANPSSKVMAGRAFHRDPAAVVELAGAYIAGMRRAGMAATLKHFPGHGGVAADSHIESPVDARARPDIESRDLAPFAALTARAAGVMTAHIQFPNIDRRAPAYSTVWLREILRARLNFTGAIFSDDLTMAGAGLGGDGDRGGDGDGGGDGDRGDGDSNSDGDDGDMPAKCIKALAAGCDLALVCNAPTGARAAADAIGDKWTPNQARLTAMRPTPAAPADVERLAAALAEHLGD